MNSFNLNNHNITVMQNGAVKCYTNNVLEQKQSKLLKEFLDGRNGNKVAIFFGSMELLEQYEEVLNNISVPSFRKLNARQSTFRDIKRKSMDIANGVCLFTTNKYLQFSEGLEYATMFSFDIIKINKIK